ncbi:MAG: thioredoxin-disulfide reductase, partial [Myxococcota bacterium]|nr:thioredoxin-disulfide reductase [Myxococcota bacterium]
MSESVTEVENVVIAGTGPAGLTAALYSARANLSPVVFEGMEPGGQLTTTTDVENFPGFPDGVMGPELMEKMKAQVTRFGARLEMDEIEEVDLSSWPYAFKTSMGKEGRTKTLIIATGASAKYLGLDNELRLRGYGVSACATCDGFFFREQKVVVVGGGDSACEEATFLTRFASEVHMFVRRDAFRASKIMADRALANPKITVHWNTEMTDVLGENEVTGVAWKNNADGTTGELEVQGVFLAIGHTPNSSAFVQWVDHDDAGYLVTQPGRTATNIEGVFAAGDVQDTVYRQAVTAAGTGCAAALEAER